MRVFTLLFLLLSLLVAPVTWADEGMYTFDNPPTAVLKRKYNFVPPKKSPASLWQMQQGSLRRLSS